MYMNVHINPVIPQTHGHVNRGASLYTSAGALERLITVIVSLGPFVMSVTCTLPNNPSLFLLSSPPAREDSFFFFQCTGLATPSTLPWIRLSSSQGLKVLLRRETVLLVLRCSRLTFRPFATSSFVGASSSGSASLKSGGPWAVGFGDRAVKFFFTGSPELTDTSVGGGGSTGDSVSWGRGALRPMRAALSLARTRTASASLSDAASLAAMLAMLKGLGCTGAGSFRRTRRVVDGGGAGAEAAARTGERFPASMG